MALQSRNRIWPLLFGWLLVLNGWVPAGPPESRPRSPLEERATLRLADPRLTIELVAAEPDVTSPVAIAWDENGYLFVAEMIDYPRAAPSGRIRRLEDRDGDGRYEHATVFAEGLSLPNGVMPSAGGLLVTAAPDIWFFRDADGDGRADERRVILTGFAEGNSQLRVNGLSWGLDNWIYGANGRSDGEVRPPADPSARSVSIRRRDFRFRFPVSGTSIPFEAIAGFSQFGLPRDDRGNRFPSWNTVPMRHVVLELAALGRNPYLAETSAVAEILDLADGGRVYGISPIQSRYNRESTSYFNATCGPTIYRGDRLPPAYRGNAFVCEPLTNLVHRRILEHAGSTFLARRAEPDREFLASTDPAFRPVNLTTGPDGDLYVVDMYRELVEHPDFVPPDLRSKVDFRRWHDRGRIWRIHSASEKDAGSPGDRRPQLGKASTAELVRLLGHPVGWWRDTAQRLLVERQDRSAAPHLAEIPRMKTSPLATLHALWTLRGLDSLNAALLEDALGSNDVALREQALRVGFQDKALGRTISGAVLDKLAGDDDLRVRLQAALVLGDRARDDHRALQALARIGRRDSDDPWMRLAVISGLGESALPFLRELAADPEAWMISPSEGQLELLTESAAIIGVRRNEPELASFLDLSAGASRGNEENTRVAIGRLALLNGLGAGLERSGSPLHEYLACLPGSQKSLVTLLGPFFGSAKLLALSDQPVSRRLLGFELLVKGRPEEAALLVPRLLGPGQPDALSLAAARAVGRLDRPELAKQVLETWPALTLATRRELLAGVGASRALAAAFVQALEDQKVVPHELDAGTRDSLSRHHDLALRQRAGLILARSVPADRSSVVARYQKALKLPGDPARGAAQFAKNCQTCHQHQGQGHRVGPDLSGIAGRAAEILLGNILDPNREIEPDFVALTVATRRGQVLSGLLAEETFTSLKLRRAEGVEDTVLRSEIAEVRSSGRSLMPEGIEQTLSVQDMADLLAFLRRGQASTH